MTPEQLSRVEILGVAPDSVEELNKMRERIKGDVGRVRLLSDPDAAVIDRYGLKNENDTRNLPHPTTFVIDPEGVVRWRFTEINYKIRPSNEDVMDALIAAGL